MSALEPILREIESATAAIVAAPAGDFAEAKAAMDRRQCAVIDLSDLIGSSQSLSEPEREGALRRLRLATEAGAMAIERLTASRSDALVEWNRWSRIYRSLGADLPSNSTIDCRG